MNFLKFLVCGLLLGATACGNDRPDAVLPALESLRFEHSSYALSSGEVVRLKLYYRTANAAEELYNNPLNPYALVWTSSDESVATITQGGMLTAKKRGQVSITLAATALSQPLSTIVRVDGGGDSASDQLVTDLSAPLSEKQIYSRNTRLKNNSVMQSFDVAADGSIYYVQIAGINEHSLNVIHGAASPTADRLNLSAPVMTLSYFGHGTNIAIEEQAEGTYVWAGSYGSKESGSNAYSYSQTLARVKYEGGTDCKPEQCTEHYYLAGARHVHPAIDTEGDVLALTCSTPRRFVCFRLSEAKALPLKMVQLAERTYGGGANDPQSEAITLSPQVQVRDLSDLTPLCDFTVAAGADYTEVNSYAFQGFDVKQNRLFFYEGEANGFVAGTPSNAYVTVYDLSGRILVPRTRVKLTDDLAALQRYSISQVGSLEAEGIKWHNGKLYLGFTARNASSSGDDRLQQIFHYDYNPAQNETEK